MTNAGSTDGPRAGRRRAVIIGGGFAGLAAARALARAPVDVVLIDRRNHHLFQPLLYQVATASLSPADIAAPIRHVLARQRNASVMLAEARAIDAAGRRVLLSGGGAVGYDWLIVGAGVRHSYFGRDDWSVHAPGLKNIEDALEIRRRFLLAFEAAEQEPDPARRREELTFVVVGAGPTGVELAGAMMEIARRAIPRDFRAVDTSTARVVLVEARERVLPGFHPDLSRRAEASLRDLGVEVRTGARVSAVTDRSVRIGDDLIGAANTIWAAGVEAESIGASIGSPVDPAGRVLVGKDLSVPGHPEIFVVGDLASLTEAGATAPVPGLCPAAVQMGRYAGRVIARESGSRSPGAREPFRYVDKGSLATIGRARAVADIRGRRFAGFVAWALWSAVHIFFLIGFRNRLIVMIQWTWAYLTYERGARLITGPGVVPRGQGDGAGAPTEEERR